MLEDLNIPQPLAENGGKKIKVELDKKALFALASDTRLVILKALQSNRKTVSQLAEEVGVDKSAVHRHLKKLEEGGFVTRNEDHGFVYYGLSWKARDIMAPGENTRIIILISSSLISVLVAVGLIVSLFLGTALGQGSKMTDASQNPVPSGIFSGPQAADHTLLLAFSIALITIGMIGAYMAWRKSKRPKLKGAPVID